MPSLRDSIIDLIDDYTTGAFDSRDLNLDKSGDLADAIIKLIEPRGESEVPKVWTEEERDRLNMRFKTASAKHGHYETLFAVAAEGIRIAAERQALATPSAPVSGPDLVRLVSDWELERKHTGEHIICAPDDDSDHDNRSETEPIAEMTGWGPEIDSYAELMTALVNAWPRLKSALASRDEWRPDIENAPLDGTPFFAWYIPDEKSITPMPRRITCRFKNSVLEYKHSHGWFTFLDGDYFRDKISHWMPEPTPPTSQERKS